MRIKIATWNMGYWQHKRCFEESWKYFLNEIDADILLFQEARPSKIIEDDKKHLVWSEIGGDRDWGSGIYSKKYELSEDTIPTQFRGSLAIAKTKVENTTLTLISLYGLMEKIGSISYSIPNLHRMVSDLTCIFNGHVDGKRNIVLGGDLNASVQLDPKQKDNSHRIFFERLEDFELRDCFKLSGKEYPVQTLRHSRSKDKWQNDYFFVSNQLSGKLKDCEVIDNDEVREFSDHNPVVIFVDL